MRLSLQARPRLSAHAALRLRQRGSTAELEALLAEMRCERVFRTEGGRCQARWLGYSDSPNVGIAVVLDDALSTVVTVLPASAVDQCRQARERRQAEGRRSRAHFTGRRARRGALRSGPAMGRTICGDGQW